MPQRVVCAVDFGTHGSGFAWCPLGNTSAPDPNEIYYFDGWKDAPVVYPKNLSALLLDSRGEVLEWGFAARKALGQPQPGGADTRRLVHGFKMWLRPSAEVSGQLRGTPAQAVPLIVAYLRRLREAAVLHITGGGYREDEIRWCLTVPAMWSDAERNLMRKAAESAGFPAGYEGLTMVTEPEAAAVYASSQESSVGDAKAPVMVVDCGGGTADIAAYRIEHDGRMVELGRPAGSQLGSAYINDRFREHILRPRFGASAMDDLVRDYPQAVQDLLDGFEKAKIDFVPATTGAVQVPIPAQIYQRLHSTGRLEALAAAQGGVDYAITVEAEAMRGLFDGLIRPLLNLVDEQIAHVRKELGAATQPVRIVLVGGFAQSRYLSSQLEQSLAKRFGKQVRFLLPPDPARAVLAGAIRYAYRPQIIKARKALWTYGIGISMPFEAGVDPIRLREYGDSRSKVYCAGRFRRFVRAGETVEVGTKFHEELYPIRSDQSLVEIILYSTALPDVRYTDAVGVRRLASINVDIGAAMRLPLDSRKINTTLHFGGTEIEVSAINAITRASVKTTVTFDVR